MFLAKDGVYCVHSVLIAFILADGMSRRVRNIRRDIQSLLENSASFATEGIMELQLNNSI
jgi:hypothetical protein